jgi:hypothetical protein
MSDLRTVPTQQLYKQWRGGSAEAGQAMAQRFSDWYYAVTSSRLGDSHGRGPLQRSCTRFQQGIVSVANESELVGWAHGILAEELLTAGGRIPGGDFPNQLTGQRSPSELLTAARAALPAEQVRLLQHAYDSAYPLDALTREAEAQGGMPLAVLRARYGLKRWLRDHEKVAFSEVPDEPNLDYKPLPLYEAGRMTSVTEETGFEKWLLSNMPLCKDIAEFGVFALALRNGALAAPAVAAPVPAPARPAAPPSAPSSPSVAANPAGRGGMMPIAIGAAVLLAFGLSAVAALGYHFLG